MAEEEQAEIKSEGIENLKVLENIDVELTVEVGRTEITIRDLLRLNEGSVVELERLAGDPLDILINNTNTEERPKYINTKTVIKIENLIILIFPKILNYPMQQ